MGLGLSIEYFGNSLLRHEDQHVVTEGLVIAAVYIIIRFIFLSVVIGNEDDLGYIE